MSTPTLTTADVMQQVQRGKSWVELHSRPNNPLLPAIPSYKVLGQKRFLQSDIDAFLAANTKKVE